MFGASSGSASGVVVTVTMAHPLTFCKDTKDTNLQKPWGWGECEDALTIIHAMPCVVGDGREEMVSSVLCTLAMLP